MGEVGAVGAVSVHPERQACYHELMELAKYLRGNGAPTHGGMVASAARQILEDPGLVNFRRENAEAEERKRRKAGAW